MSDLVDDSPAAATGVPSRSLDDGRRAVTSRAATVLGVIAYMALFNFAYVTIIYPNYEYMGFDYSVRSPLILSLAGALAVLPAFWIPTRLGRPSVVVYWLMYLLVLVPTSFVPFYSLNLDSASLLLLLFALTAAFAMWGMIYRLPLLKPPVISLSPVTFWLGVLAVSAVCHILMVSTFGLRVNIVALADIYDIRGDFSESASESGKLISYVVFAQANVINPLLLAVGLLTRRTSLLALGVLGQLFIYTFTGFRSVLFSSLMIFAFFFTIGKSGDRFGPRITWGLTALVGVSVALYYFTDSIMMSSIFVQRMIATPALLTGFYYEFFTLNEQAWLAHSIFKSFIIYPYADTPPYMIGKYYFGSNLASANGNLWADSFANFGFLGIFAFTGVLAVILWIYDSIASTRDLRFATLMFALPAFTLTNSALITTLMTHGMALVMVLVFLAPATLGISQPKPRKRAPAQLVGEEP